MGYRFIDKNNIVPEFQDNNGLGISWNSPFRKPLRISIQQARENLKTLLLTKKGERIMYPDFGTDLLNLIFEPSTDDVLKQQITTIIDDAVSKYLPYLELENITILTAEDLPGTPYNVHVSLQYSLNDIEDTLQLQF